MSISVYPATGDITAAAWAAALDALFGGVDHGNTDLAFQLSLQSQAGGNNTWVLTAGSYLFDGYIFTSDGTDTVTVVEGQSRDIGIYYVLTNGFITDAGISPIGVQWLPAGAVSLTLFTVNGPVAGATAPNTRTDNRRINTWGRAAYANSDADAITLSAVRSVQVTTAVSIKSFRVAYPGSYQLDFEYKELTGAYANIVALKRAGTTVWSAALSNSAIDWTAYSAEISGCQPGDTIEVINVDGNPLYVRSAYLRYKLTDAEAAAVLVD